MPFMQWFYGTPRFAWNTARNNLKTQEIAKKYEDAAWNRERLAAEKSLDISNAILKFTEVTKKSEAEVSFYFCSFHLLYLINQFIFTPQSSTSQQQKSIEQDKRGNGDGSRLESNKKQKVIMCSTRLSDANINHRLTKKK